MESVQVFSTGSSKDPRSFTHKCAFVLEDQNLLNFNRTSSDADFSPCVQFAACQLQENGITQLSLLSAVSQHDGVWTNQVLRGLLSGERLPTERGEAPDPRDLDTKLRLCAVSQ